MFDGTTRTAASTRPPLSARHILFRERYEDEIFRVAKIEVTNPFMQRIMNGVGRRLRVAENLCQILVGTDPFKIAFEAKRFLGLPAESLKIDPELLAKGSIDRWTQEAGITDGPLLRPV
jgi:hypothetical protein